MKKTDDHRNQSLSLALLIAAALAIVGVVYWQLQRSGPTPLPEPALPEPGAVVAEVEPQPAAPEPAIEQEERVTAAPPVAPPKREPVVRLPQLDRSDPEVTNRLLEVSGGAFQSWLVQEHLIRKFVRAVNALEEGKLVSQYRPFNPPDAPFSAEQSGDIWRVQQDNYARYTPYLESLEKVGPEGLARLYKHYAPLLQQAYEELGVDKGSFKEVTIRALTRITKTPVPPPDAPLARPSVTFKFATPELEQRSQVEKLLFRLGPENSVRLKKLASDLLAELQRG